MLSAIALTACGGGASDGGGSTTQVAQAAQPQLLATVTSVSELYVATTGSDTNSGSASSPLKTIAKASQLAQPGTVVHVAPGTYPGGFKTVASGTATARIRYQSDTRWGARIVPPSSSATDSAWDNRGNYVDVVGFDVDGSVLQQGTAWTTGIYNGGSNDSIANNHVHHISKAACTTGGGGIGVDSYYGGVNASVDGNVIHDIGPAVCADMHGIYFSTNGVVSNNLVYAVSETGIRLWHDANRVTVVNNTLFNTNTGISVGGGDYYHTAGPSDYNRVSNNIVYDNRSYGVIETGATGSHNVYANNLLAKNAVADWRLQNGLLASGSISADPAFVNYVRTGGGDYHLSSASPAIDRGNATSAPLTDLDGAKRPSGATFDIGAYEFGAVGGTSGSGSGSTTTQLPTTANHLYVATTGADSNPGTASAPFRTIARAAQVALPDTTILVAPGTYAGGFRTAASGIAGKSIYYVSSTRWGARILPPATSSNDTAWDNRGNYVVIDGFEIDGTTTQAGTPWSYGIYTGGSYNTIRNTHVHHIASKVACTSAGGSAIGVDSYYGGVMGTVDANLVHDIGPAGCSFIQGIYISTSGSVTNNIVYRVAEAGIHLWHDANHVTIANNTVAASNTGIIVGGGDFYRTAGPDDYTNVTNNIVYDNRYGISEQGSTGIHNTYTNNLVYQNASYDWSLKNGLKSVAGISAAPGFAAYTRTGTPDFRLLTSSPAIGSGSTVRMPTNDFVGIVRTSADIGAYQH
ncbi:DUF1565 domain-containing protein [Massilia sp. TW-1]|uniref:DUF1565 domain-containing protein n=2 Tax=Telluria antibiotica TaxID=2717319 RepID=A0ABX0P6I1_9BURK|nr:DUF1565 domain-containing protein [Telluria antibiotica]